MYEWFFSVQVKTSGDYSKKKNFFFVRCVYILFCWIFLGVISLPSRNNQETVSQEVMKCLAILVVCVVGAAVAGNVHQEFSVMQLPFARVCVCHGRTVKIDLQSFSCWRQLLKFIFCATVERTLVSANRRKPVCDLDYRTDHPLGKITKFIFILFGWSEWEHQRQVAFYQLLSSIDENNKQVEKNPRVKIPQKPVDWSSSKKWEEWRW